MGKREGSAGEHSSADAGGACKLCAEKECASGGPAGGHLFFWEEKMQKKRNGWDCACKKIPAP